MKGVLCWSVVAALLIAQFAVAEEASLERGKALFENTKLGNNGKSCATCHPGGKKLEWAATSYDDAKLVSIINRCIKGSLKGEPLDPESIDMKSLAMYIKTFSGPGN
ncbi:cytochrome c [Geotalea uraniireducens]|uniref:Cytochrome c n=1 Tax=Geotalea uraniireducens TaxID=351604 RepID=A0ABN6VXQ1_9BACT|nr:cytochrome C [Geotalea uraniireducens]BDV43245.1 cytochrome c [Geotalea uraniireducens]